MGLQQFEHRLEQLVEGVFARAFRGGLQPVELGRRMTREMDLERTMGVRGLVAPNHFTFALSSKDIQRFEPFAEALVQELQEAAREHGRSEGYHFMGAVEVDLIEDSSLPPGVFRVAAEVSGTGGPAALVLPDGRRVALEADSVIIGRLPECGIVLADPNVSRRHAEVRREGGQHVVVDLGSTNGTKVNGSLIRTHPLSDGDEITVGASVLRFESA